MSLTKAEKEALKAELVGFKFDTPVGAELRRFINFGIGVHHAGRGLHSSTFQLNLSLFCHKPHPKHPIIAPNTP